MANLYKENLSVQNSCSFVEGLALQWTVGPRNHSRIQKSVKKKKKIEGPWVEFCKNIFFGKFLESCFASS